MDLRLYFRVLWRFKLVVIAGFVAALALAFLSMVSVSLSHGLKLKYRQAETWQTQSTLLITQHGFPFGRSVLPVDIPPASSTTKAQTIVPKFGDPSWFYNLAMLYSRLAQSDAVMHMMGRPLPPNEKVSAAPIYTSDASNASTLPMLQVSGYATTPRLAVQISSRATHAFLRYLDNEQAAAGIPASQRILVQEVNRPSKPLLVAGRKKTTPVMIFVAIMTLAIGLAFILENMRPRIREVAATAPRHDLPSEARQTA